MCNPQDILIQFFLWEQCPFLNFEIWWKWKIQLKQLVSTTPLKLLNRIAWNFVVMKDIMCRFDPFEEQFISPFLSDCPSLMLGSAIHCIPHSQAMLEYGVCELADSFFHIVHDLDMNGLCTLPWLTLSQISSWESPLLKMFYSVNYHSRRV